MASVEKVVGVKKVRQKDSDGWDVSIPLPRDIMCPLFESGLSTLRSIRRDPLFTQKVEDLLS